MSDRQRMTQKTRVKASIPIYEKSKPQAINRIILTWLKFTYKKYALNVISGEMLD